MRRERPVCPRPGRRHGKAIAGAPPLGIFLAALLPLGPACVDGTGGGVPLPEADFDAFRDEVQPVLESRCANPSCHGSAARPLELYARHLHRLDPDELFLDTPLSEEELRLNFQRCRAFLLDVTRPEECLLLLKPLAPEAGGASHGGGTQFEDAEDGEYRRIEAWIEDALARAGAGGGS